MTTIISNKKSKFSKLLVILFFLVFLLSAKYVSAAELSLSSDSKDVNIGNTIAVDVLINTEGESINVVDGNITIPNGLDLIEIKELSSANSALNQWVRTPSWSKKDGTISFIGGLPGGLNQKSANLFRIFFTARSLGQVTFSPSDIKVYANDGKATLVGVHSTSLTININKADNSSVKDALQTTITKDYKAPTDINVDLGQDASLFDGQKFINVSATDSDSGIAYFEVKEGNREPVRTSSSYVLQNQNNLEPIIIFAFDKAGNVSKKILSPHSSVDTNNNLFIIIDTILIVAFIASVFILCRIFKKKKKSKK